MYPPPKTVLRRVLQSRWPKFNFSLARSTQARFPWYVGIFGLALCYGVITIDAEGGSCEVLGVYCDKRTYFYKHFEPERKERNDKVRRATRV